VHRSKRCDEDTVARTTPAARRMLQGGAAGVTLAVPLAYPEAVLGYLFGNATERAKSINEPSLAERLTAGKAQL
jgi:hypothetical protein